MESVFGIIKSVMDFRQFLLRGLDNVRNEWTLVCLAWNFKRMAILASAVRKKQEHCDFARKTADWRLKNPLSLTV